MARMAREHVWRQGLAYDEGESHEAPRFMNRFLPSNLCKIFEISEKKIGKSTNFPNFHFSKKSSEFFKKYEILKFS